MKINSPPSMLSAQRKVENEIESKKGQLREVAKLYEGEFLKEMVRQMRKNVGESGFIEKGMAEKIFEGELDNKYVESWTEHGGVGLADMIYDQLIERYGSHLGIPKETSPQESPAKASQGLAIYGANRKSNP